ncbi:sensor histidine kinase [Patulibacter defluvii]|uniref:sensor histidine kinase n=1 Tax=Patulibacter defluvii TaxID=3095358 RepID=UPI002A7628EC|nr:histidine kinase [Patulibacter sp. DM4]
MSRWRGPGRRSDALLGLGLVAIGLAETVLDRPPGGLLAHLLLALPLLAVGLLRERGPVAMVLAATGFVWAKALVSGFDQPSSAGWLVALLMAYLAGRDGRGPAVVAAVAGLLASLELIWIAYPESAVSDYFYPTFFALLAFVGGRVVHQHVRIGVDLHETAARVEEHAEHERERARADERRRIAREMHDVIAHSVSVMVVQAGGARRILDRDPARAVEAAALVERTGREALGELRTLLGAIDRTAAATAIAPPAPSLERVEELLERARAAGLPVRLERRGAAGELPAGVDLAAYRIVQEALTNVLRHAGPVATTVTVERAPDALVVDVRNGPGRAPQAGLSRPGGHGLLGMGERAAVYGGRIEAGPTADGGFAVRARLPISERMEVPA